MTQFVTLTDEESNPIGDLNKETGEVYAPEQETKPSATRLPATGLITKKRVLRYGGAGLGMLIGYKLSPEKTIGILAGLVLGVIVGDYAAKKLENTKL